MLRDYQEDISTRAAAILREYGLVYLAMWMRTGKSITALATADKYGAKKVLFVTKKKAISSVEKDDEKYDPPYELTTINYEQLHNIIGVYDLFILDEASCLGQFPRPAERVRLLKQMCEGKPIIYLSGGPTPESDSQIYHQFYISSFSPFRQWTNFYKWATEFVTVRKRYFFNREINDYSRADRGKIDSLTHHLFISFTQAEAGFETTVKEEVLTVKMEEGTYLLAAYLKKHKVHIGREGEEVLADTAVKLMSKWHQIFSGSVIDQKGNGIGFDLSKAKFIKQRFEGKKIAIFYKFQAERLMLVAAFGSDRLTDDPMEFNERNDKIFVSQFQSGSMGTNLSTADCLVMMNIDFSATIYWQVRERLQDKNRSKEALVYWVFAEGGIEQKVYERVQQKKDFTLQYFKQAYNLKKDKELA
jgi:hypothetical protein